MSQSTWNPEQYARFRTERSQPFVDLLALVQRRPDMRVVDLGCGSGELTHRLHQELRARDTLGIDSSDTMLAAAAAHAGNGLRFALADLATFTTEQPYDLIFSNAALHWVPGHPDLLRRLTQSLAPDGQLAMQVPANHDHPSHLIAHTLAAEEPFRSALHGYVRTAKPVLAPEEYATLLDQLGYRQQHVRLQVYAHHLPSRAEVVEWVKGTLLTDYQRRLSAEMFAEFLARYRDRLLPQLDDTQPYFYPFKRILCWGRR